MEAVEEAVPKGSWLKKLMPVLRNKYLLLLILEIFVGTLIAIFCIHGYKTEQNYFGLKGFEDTHVMIFVGFGFLMTFLKKYAYSALGFNFLLAAFATQWALFNQQIYHRTGGYVIITKKTIIEADIASATVLITFGALLGWTSGLQLIIVTFFECIFVGLNFYIVEHFLHGADVGGSICIHTFGAYFGLACSFALGFRRNNKQGSSESAVLDNLNTPSYMSDITAMIGTLFLFIYWPSFNSALTHSQYEYQRAVVNTYLSLMACTVSSYCLSSFVSHDKRFDMVHIQNSTLAGGVAIGAICNMCVSPGVAIAVGFCAGIMSVLGYKYITPKLEKWGIVDTCGVHNLHGLPGVYSGILSVVVACLAIEAHYPDGEYFDIFPGIAAGQTPTKQGVNQLLSLLATLAVSIGGGILTGILTRFIAKPDKLSAGEKYNDEVNWELPIPYPHIA